MSICHRGHELTPENTGLDRGRVRCLACHREDERRRGLARSTAKRERRRVYLRAWSRTPSGRDSIRRSDERKVQSGAIAARVAVAAALANGTLERLACARCGLSPTDAHHYLGYARDHRLHVVWLCRFHHEVAHHGLPDHLIPLGEQAAPLWVTLRPHKLQCAHGHALDEANTYVRKDGRRICRTCHRLWMAAYVRRGAA